MLRTLYAFLLAPVIPGTIFATWSALTGDADGGWWVFMVMALIAYPMTALIGTPVYLALGMLKWNALQHYLLAGLILSSIPSLLPIVIPSFYTAKDYPEIEPITSGDITLMAMMAASCMACASAFWFIARPDQQASQNT